MDNGAKWIYKGVIIMMDDGIKTKSDGKLSQEELFGRGGKGDGGDITICYVLEIF